MTTAKELIELPLQKTLWQKSADQKTLSKRLGWPLGVAAVFFSVVGGVLMYLQALSGSSGLVWGWLADVTISKSSESIWQIYFTIVGTLYAVSTVFLIVKEMQDFAEIKRSYRKESMSIQSILIYLEFLEEDIDRENKGRDGPKEEQLEPPPRSKKASKLVRREGAMLSLIGLLSSYVESIIQELTNMNFSKLPGSSMPPNDRGGFPWQPETRRSKLGYTKSEEKILEATKLMANLELVDSNDKIAIKEIMARLDAILSLRATRTDWLDIGLSPYMRAFLVVLSATIVLPFVLFSIVSAPVPELAPEFLVSVGRGNTQILCLILGTTLAAFTSFVYVTLRDIGDPRDGHWRVQNMMFVRLKHEIDMRLDEAMLSNSHQRG